MFSYIRNTLMILWADLWIRQEVFHWTASSFAVEYSNSVFKSKLNRHVTGVDKVDYLPVSSSAFGRALEARREIVRKVNGDWSPVKVFLLRQWAWFLYCRTGRIPEFVFKIR